MEFIKMLKNDYINKVTTKEYIRAEIVKEYIEEMLIMYDEFIEATMPKEENKSTHTVDVITQLQEKMKNEQKRAWQ